MTKINLREFYPWYKEDTYIDVPNEVAAELMAGRRAEVAHQRQVIRNKAQYSLDCEDGIECAVCHSDPTPQELLERKELFIHLWNALNTLPELQGRRVDACIICGMSYRAVARAEGVDKAAVRMAVKRGLENMKNISKKFCNSVLHLALFCPWYIGK